jgi:O-antigen ligase
VRESRPDEVTEPVPAWWERASSIGLIALLTGALIGPVFAPTQEETPVLRLVWLPAYAAIIGMILFRLDRMWRAWPAGLAVLAMLMLAFASKYWSIDPGVTQRRVIALAMSAAFALYLGAVFRGPHLPRLLMQASLLMAIGSLVMVFAFPAIGVHQLDNAGLWRGLWYEKNQMGAVMVIGATAAAACLASPDPRKLLPWAALGLTTLLVLATQSKTSLLCLALGLAMVGGFWTLKKGGAAFTVAAIWAGVVVAGLAVWTWNTHSVTILEALGKDPSLTGRTEIWDSLMRKVADRPWTGFGYSAFWGKDSVPADWVRKETGWLVPSAHNGWVDLLIQLGWPGAILTAILISSTTVITVLRSTGAGVREGWWALGFLAAFIALSFSESILMAHQGLPWVLFLAVLTRAILPSSTAEAAPLAPRPRRAYQTAPRIAAQYGYGSQRRAFPVR